MFEPFRHQGMQYLSIPDGDHFRIISFTGDDFGRFLSIEAFKKNLAHVTPGRFTHLIVENKDVC